MSNKINASLLDSHVRTFIAAKIALPSKNNTQISDALANIKVAKPEFCQTASASLNAQINQIQAKELTKCGSQLELCKTKYELIKNDPQSTSAQKAEAYNNYQIAADNLKLLKDLDVKSQQREKEAMQSHNDYSEVFEQRKNELTNLLTSKLEELDPNKKNGETNSNALDAKNLNKPKPSGFKFNFLS